jgi:hypothetical protein
VLDPVVTGLRSTRNQAYLVFDTLYGIDTNWTAQPQMVEGHQVDEDGLTWTLTLRDGLLFHDKEPVLARDVVASIRRFAARISLANALMAATEELSAPDDRTVRFHLKRPFPHLPEAQLGISDVEWMRYPNGDPIAAYGLRMRPRDLAKIGRLVLAHGAWAGRQIFPAAWIEQSLTPQINGVGLSFYGFQWWLGRSLVERREIDWAAGVGLGGQRLYAVPTEDLAVVVTAGLYKAGILQDLVGLTVLNRYVLPALAR